MFGLGGHAYNALSGAVHATTLSTTGMARIANVGAAPTSHTDAVNPALHVAGGMSVAGHVWINTGVSTGSFTSLSDRRRKRNIVPLGRSIVPDLVPVRFDMLDEEGTVVEEGAVGFVAQDVAPVDPSLVRGSEAATYSLDYRGIGVHAVAEIQRLARTLEQQAGALALHQQMLEQQAGALALHQQRIDRLLRDLEGRSEQSPPSPQACPEKGAPEHGALQDAQQNMDHRAGQNAGSTTSEGGSRW